MQAWTTYDDASAPLADVTRGIARIGLGLLFLQHGLQKIFGMFGGQPVALTSLMGVAGMLGHKGAGYLITNDPPGAEYTINLAVICFVFLLTGPGALSLDAILF